MSLSTTGSVESKWLLNFAEMRKAIENLKLPNHDLNQPQYGSDLGLSDDEFTYGQTSDDIWDLLAVDQDQDEAYHSGQELVNNAAIVSSTADRSAITLHDRNWLALQCNQAAECMNDLDADALQNQILAVLASDSSDAELQMLLVDILGYDELDLASDIIAHRDHLLTKHAQPGVYGQLKTKRERQEALTKGDYEHKHAVLAPARNQSTTQYPHVYRSHENGNTLNSLGKKYSLPQDSSHHDHQRYEEYSIPATKVGTLGTGQSLVAITDLDGLCQRTFAGYKSLNRMQSLVYPIAYKTSENMLVCAPTGAGKTDAAMLTILNTIAKNLVPNPIDQPDATDFAVRHDQFKIVYVAPMKALAAEITEKLGKRLAWLGVQVRELTGDMQLSKSEIIATQIIITTPEKWDVVTRKSTGDTELVHKVRLLIIDEVHMLHDERGAVLESLVARTQRQVESTQSLIRIVGLSATLPNFIDVADFLKVNLMAGLFYFDASFRPVPLEQHFLGIKGRAGSKQSRDNIDQVAYEKVSDMIKMGHQVMLFVHSRKDTLKSARDLLDKAQLEGEADLFDSSSHPAYDLAVRDVKQSKGKELRELVPKGMGIHHAGMPRTDRNLVERLFTDGVLNVLCCTATLAWGVNLPAAAVVIKGTQLYSAEAGKFVDLGILDVLQIFGRAGRPQFQDTGIGFILTTQDKIHHYLNAVTQQLPIESSFSKRLVDNLNAEIALGTVTSVQDAVQWLGYSYLFVRMQRNHLAYGIEWSEKRDDPQLVQRRRKLVIDAAKILQQSQMIIFNEKTEELRSKDAGRIASQFYIQQSSVDIFNTLMSPQGTEADDLAMISRSGEFKQIQSRENEENELTKLKLEHIPCEIKGKGVSTSEIKTNILLQSFISRIRLDDFTLASDSAYIAKNSARICRALFMMALNRSWGHQCLVLLSLCKSIEKQIWSYQHPLHQFDLPLNILRQLDDKGTVASIESLHDMTAAEIASMVNNQKMGWTIKNLIKNIPVLNVEVEIAPLNRDVLRIKLYLIPDFAWNDRHHGNSESYWIWVENSDTSEIYHHEFFILTRKKMWDNHELHFTIPLADPIPSQIYVRAISDRWLGAETVTPVSFQHLIRPDTESVYTDLLNLQPLSITALNNPPLEELYSKRFQYFNPMQTQLFHCLYHTPANVLLGSPTGSGKTVAAELAMWWAFREHPGSKVVYIAPMKALVRERVQDWGKRLAQPLGLKLVELTGDNTPDTRTIRDADIIITTPEKWDGISRSWQTRGYVQQVSLVIIDEIHLLGGDRGPVLEIIVSRMNYIASEKKGSVRLLGMSTACANATDLGNWLGVKEGLFNFRHSVRPVPLEIYIDGFPETRGFCPLMQSMNRPTFLAIKSHSPDKPVIVFVASRRQTRLTAKDLINFCGMEDNPRRFVNMSEDDLTINLSRVKDEALRESLSFGIGLHHAGLVEADRQLSEELFVNNKIQILVATSTLAWGVNLPAHLVVVKGTQFFDAKTEGYKDMDLTDVLQMLGRAGRPQFDNSGIARIFTQDAKKAFYKHFLHTGFPVESSLHLVLANHLGAEISAETIAHKQDALDYLTWTFFFRRLHKNPTFYGLEISAEEHNTMTAQELASEYMIDMVDKSLKELADSGCAIVLSSGEIVPTPYGKIMSYYYLSHKTIRSLLAKASTAPTFEDVLSWLSIATEFDELPVRHNEDLINAELAKNLPLDAVKLGLVMWDPHVKAYLLLQAHFGRISLPISDYVGDQISVLDQSIRVCQAAIDLLAEKGYLMAVEMMLNLMQCIKSARWPTDGPLGIFPGVNVESEKKRIDKGKVEEATLKWVTELPRLELQKIAAASGVGDGNMKRFLDTVALIPKLQLHVPETSSVGFSIQLVREHFLKTKDNQMYSPRFAKPQTEGFFVLVAEQGNDELVALKRIGWNTQTFKGQQTATATIKLAESVQDKEYIVHVISDGYIGLDWTIENVSVPATPAPVPTLDKKPA